ncbi:MAG: hypothetical protein RSF90_03825, partial [Pygmaiobacter sp.]
CETPHQFIGFDCEILCSNTAYRVKYSLYEPFPLFLIFVLQLPIVIPRNCTIKRAKIPLIRCAFSGSKNAAIGKDA